jgi:hypothetical protein
MTFPATPLDLRTELLLGGTWTDVTAYVDHGTSHLTITRGHPDESTTTAPSGTQVTLFNGDARFSARNPTGPYYGLLGRNVPMRVSVPEGASYLRSDLDQSSYASTPDSAGLSITGDTEIQIDLTLSSWRQPTVLASKFGNGGAFSWLLLLQASGNVELYWSADGSAFLQNRAASTAAIPNPPGGTALRRCAVKVTYAAASATVSFYTAPDITSSWTALGSPVAVAGGATSIFDSTAPVILGGVLTTYPLGAFTGYQGKIHGFKLLSGIGGTTKASPDFTSQAPGATSFSDAQSNVWTLGGTAEISNRRYRLHGECSAFPQRWGPAGKDPKADVTAAGLLRRLGQGSSPLNSTMYRATVRLAGTSAQCAYWPGEDGAGSTQLASGLGGPAMPFTGSPTLASSSAFACSNPLPVLNGSQWAGTVPAYTGGTVNLLRFLISVPTAGDVNNGVIARMTTAGTVRTLDLVYTTASGGSLTTNAYDLNHALLGTGTSAGWNLNGVPMILELSLNASGGNVAGGVLGALPGSSTVSTGSGTGAFAGTIGNVLNVYINPGGLLTGTAIGHVSVQPVYDNLNFAGVATGPVSALSAYAGETAGTRFARLCAEEGITFRGIGYLADTAVMGAQTAQHLTNLLQECADADRGQIIEPRQCLGLGYRTRVSMQNQAPAVTLAYTQLANELLPTEDDQFIFNDITVTNTDGSFAEQVLATGALSVQAPPAGVGRYDTSTQVNLNSDGDLASTAGWAVHMATVNEPRYPAINVDLATSAVASLFNDLQEFDLGDRIVITGTPAWLPPGGIDELLQGVTENIYMKIFSEAWACVPSSPWNAAVAGDAVFGHADTDGSTVHANITSGATSMQVDTTNAASPLWTTNAADFPFDINVAGERMTVTNISGSSSPQTFTITRSVNGVAKAQTAGTDVRLFFPAIVSL